MRDTTIDQIVDTTIGISIAQAAPPTPRSAAAASAHVAAANTRLVDTLMARQHAADRSFAAPPPYLVKSRDTR